MPKSKKPPRNSYYFFMVDKKKELEGKGYRFMRGMKDIAEMPDIREEWKALSTDEKFKYEQLAKEAKEEDKHNLHNKFTCSGESYAERDRREEEAKQEAKFLNKMLITATKNTDSLEERCFVLFKSWITCETDHPNSKYFPVELAVASFCLETGLKKKWWTLVDTKNVPMGFASCAKENNEMTALPIPGSSKFKPEHANYAKILNTIRGFISLQVEPFEGYYAVYTMPGDDERWGPGCLRWLWENAQFENAEARHEMDDFLKHLKFLRIPALLCKLASTANKINPRYKAVIATHELEQAAMDVLTRSDLDYKDNITCSFHNQEKESLKTHMCALNIIMRSIFMMLEELIEPMGIAKLESHVYTCVKAPNAYAIMEKPAFDPTPSTSREEEPQPSSELLDAWNEGSTPTMFKQDDFPDLTSGGPVKH